MTIRIAEAGRAIARPADRVHPDAPKVRFRTDAVGRVPTQVQIEGEAFLHHTMPTQAQIDRYIEHFRKPTETWVPAARVLPTYTPGIIYDFPDTSGMHDILTYEALQIACQREDAAPRPMTGFFAGLTPAQRVAALAYDGPENHGDPTFRRQPDDPGVTVPRAPRPNRIDAIEIFGICLTIAASAGLGIWMIAKLAGAA